MLIVLWWVSQLSRDFGLVSLSGFILGWTWWCHSVPRWRRWTHQRGVNPDRLQKWAVITGLVWRKGSWFEKTERNLKISAEIQRPDIFGCVHFTLSVPSSAMRIVFHSKFPLSIACRIDLCRRSWLSEFGSRSINTSSLHSPSPRPRKAR